MKRKGWEGKDKIWKKRNLDEGKRERGSGRGDVGREAQANVGWRIIYVFRKRVIIGGLRNSKMVSWKNLQEAETKIYNKTKTQENENRNKRKQKKRKQKQK